MTLSSLARAYYSEGCRGNPVSLSQSKKLFLKDLRYGNGKFKPLKSMLKRMGWHENKRLTPKQISLIIARLGEA